MGFLEASKTGIKSDTEANKLNLGSSCLEMHMLILLFVIWIIKEVEAVSEVTFVSCGFF